MLQTLFIAFNFHAFYGEFSWQIFHRIESHNFLILKGKISQCAKQRVLDDDSNNLKKELQATKYRKLRERAEVKP